MAVTASRCKVRPGAGWVSACTTHRLDSTLGIWTVVSGELRKRLKYLLSHPTTENRRRVSALALLLPFRTAETVPRDTPTYAATSWMRGRLLGRSNAASSSPVLCFDFFALRLGAKYADRFCGISAHSSITRAEELEQFVEEPLTEFSLSLQPNNFPRCTVCEAQVISSHRFASLRLPHQRHAY